ncbi:MAG TPA: acetyl-CoA C-acyltransferase [Candidatus Saccharimonadales bacterium]|nr:acetyl-CoA C-acyltransferase [Candidatus Saccharimonadales bacterium]
MAEAVIVAAGRSPIGRAGKGSLVECRPDDLGAYILSQVLAQIPQLDPLLIEDVICGCGLPGGESGFNMGRAISILAGVNAPGTTLTRYCSSSLQTTRMAYHAIRAGEGEIFASVGVETVSRFGYGTSDPADARNPRLLPGNPEGFPDLYLPMGMTAENVAEREGITREEMDQFAARSQNRAVAAQAEGFFDREIIPVTVPSGQVVERDDGPRPNTTVEVLSTLKPVFKEGGRVTAGNACPLNDGAAAVIIMSQEKAKELGITPLARIVGSALAALEPEYMGLGPIPATQKVLNRTGTSMDDLDIVEINEAFAAQVIPAARGIGLDPMEDRLNPFGGSIALGHPFGMTGARITCTLLNGLRTRDKALGLETMCVGGGMGMAMILERLA